MAGRPGRGSPVVCVRLNADDRETILAYLEERRGRAGVLDMTLSDFIRTAVAEKCHKLRRGRTSAEGITTEEDAIETATREGLPRVERQERHGRMLRGGGTAEGE